MHQQQAKFHLLLIFFSFMVRSNAGNNEVRRKREVISAEEILSATARHLDCDYTDLLNARRGRGADIEGRLIAKKLCQKPGGMKLSAKAESSGVGSDSAISRAIGRFSQDLSIDFRLQKIFSLYISRPEHSA